MDRITLTQALDKLTETDICDLINDQNSMHNFGLGVGQVTRLNQFGTNGNTSNMMKAYTIKVANPKASTETTGKTIFAAVLNEAIAHEHVLTLQSNTGDQESIIAPEDYPHRGTQRQMYQTEQHRME